MLQKLLYVELKSGHHDAGPAWIGVAKLSRSGRTIYFNGKALKRSVGGGVQGNHHCVETGDEYWVSGPKKCGGDRHRAGGGPIEIERRALDDYVAFRGGGNLDPTQYLIVADFEDTDIVTFTDRENEPL